MKKTLHPFLLLILTSIIFISCSSDSGDNWTLINRISLGDVSLMVPETYEYTNNIDTEIEVSNGFDGSSVGILKEADNGLTQDSIFNYKTLHYPYGTPTAYSDTILADHTARMITTTIPVAPGIGGEHTFISYILIDDGWVYTIDFAWSKEEYYLSLNLMYDMLNTLQIK